ncbi:MAG: hypothetical protein ABFE07_11950, partial [Armatimonadia bacterium]
MQQALGVSHLVGPGLLISSIRDDVDECHAALWRCSCEFAPGNTPLYLSVVVDEPVLADFTQRSLLIDALIRRREATGFYILAVTQTDHGHSSDLLLGLMDCICHLRSRGFKTVIGCCGVEALLYAAVGASAVAVGMQPNTQRFGDGRWVEAPDIRMKNQRPKWALVSHLLRELRLTQIGLLKASDPHYWWQCECAYCDIMRNA